ncbi:MAG: hypothetical protein RL748_638 [Pseudomonadota bacterium]
MSSHPDSSELCPWHAVIEACFAEFMQFYFPLAHGEINWEQPVRFLQEEMGVIQQQLPLNEAPLQCLVQVSLHSGQLCQIYILVAWQGEATLARHMAQVQSCTSLGTGGPAACFALMGQNGQAPPAAFTWSCLGSHLAYYYTCHYFSDFAGQESSLLSSDNGFALLTLANLIRHATMHDMAGRYAQKWRLIQSMFERGWSRERIILLFLALDWSLPLPLRWSQQLWRNIEQFEEQQIMRYVSSVERFVRERERQQGIVQGESNMLRRILVQRFGELPLWVGMQMQGGNSEQHGLWLERALAAHSLDEVFHDEV